MKRLGTRVNLIPVIAKADTMSPADLEVVKDRVRRTIVAQGIKVYVPPVEEGDMASAEHSKALIVSRRRVGVWCVWGEVLMRHVCLYAGSHAVLHHWEYR